jgi:tRNA-dihydrouridine synthase C
MEGLGDRRLRRALAFSTGGFDEACREFTRVPGVLSQGARPEKLLRGIALTGYDADELTDWTKFAWNEWDQDALGTPPPTSRAPNLLAAQLMGSNEELLERCARFLANEGGAPRVDLNCGCPANVVTGKGAGSSLLRDPRDVESCAAAVARGVAGTGCAVTVKLRSGFDDRGLLRDNLLAAQEGGAEFITLHPRTRAQGYSGRADWDDIAFAADLLHIPVVGNGDVTSASLAAKMVRETGCAGVMIGRGAVQDPLVFRRCVAALSTTRSVRAIRRVKISGTCLWRRRLRRSGVFSVGSRMRCSGRLRGRRRMVSVVGVGVDRWRRIASASRLAS